MVQKHTVNPHFNGLIVLAKAGNSIKLSVTLAGFLNHFLKLFLL